MSLVQEAGSQPLAQFTVPYKGTHRSSAAHEVPTDALFQSNNVWIRQGKLRSRPGLTFLNGSVFQDRIIGGAMAVTPESKILLAIGKDHLYTLQDSDSLWQVDTEDAFAHNDYETIDMCFLETMDNYFAIIANSHYSLKQWSNGNGAQPIVATVGVVPRASSVCSAARRIIALTPPHTVSWSSTLNHTSWPALGTAGKIAQTNDTAICIRSLGNLDFVIYKERSLYVAKAQAGSDAAAFNIRFLQRIEGPAGINSVVDVAGVHYFMTKNGRIGLFDGSTYVQWVADGVWLYLQNDIDPQYSKNIFGVYDYRLHTITFYYPKKVNNFPESSEGLMYGMIIINLPFEGLDLQSTNQVGLAVKKSQATFLGLSGRPCSYGFEMRFDETIDRAILFTAGTLPYTTSSLPTAVQQSPLQDSGQSTFIPGTDPQSFVSDELAVTDAGIVFECSFDTGLIPMPGMKHTALTLEAFFERGNGFGAVAVYGLTLDSLEAESPTIASQEQLIDLNNNPVREYLGFNIPTRFFGLRYSWQSNVVVRYAGTSIYGRLLA